MGIKAGHPGLSSWEDGAGVICPRCHEEAFQVIGGVCARCAKKKTVDSERTIERRAVFRGLRQRLKDARAGK